MRQAIKFLNEIKNNHNVIIVFNNDTDGMCSCALIKKVLKRLEKTPYIISQPMPTDKNLLRRIQTTLPDKIIFLDLGIDQQDNLIKIIRRICDILIIDHHQVSKNVNSKNIVHYNPRFKNKDIYQSTTYLAYKICSKIMDMKNEMWIAAIGIVADYALEDSGDIIEEIAKKYSVDKNLHETVFKKIFDMINSARALNMLSCEEIVEMLCKAEDYEDFIKFSAFMESYKKIENEKIGIMVDAEKSAENKGKILLYEFKARSNLRSTIATDISERHKDRLIVIYERVGTRIKLSARNQNKNIDVGRVLEKAIKDLNASAGGHEAAGGATINEKDWEKFKENLIEIVNG